MNSDQLNVWLTKVMQESLPEWVQLGAQDVADEVKRQWGDKARRRAEERYSYDRQTCLASSKYAVSVKLTLTCIFDREARTDVAEDTNWIMSPAHRFQTTVSNTTWVTLDRWWHPAISGFDITFDTKPMYDMHNEQYILHGEVDEVLRDKDAYLGVQEVLQSAERTDREGLLHLLLKRWLHGTHEHHWIAAAPNVDRCLFCHMLRAKKPNKQAYYRIDDRVRVTSGTSTSKSVSCKFVRPMRGSYTAEQMDMALRIASDDNFTISSLK